MYALRRCTHLRVHVYNPLCAYVYSERVTILQKCAPSQAARLLREAPLPGRLGRVAVYFTPPEKVTVSIASISVGTPLR